MHDGTETLGWSCAAIGIAALSVLSRIFLIV